MMKEKKSLKGSKMAGVLASTALKVAGMSANSRCMYVYHQPKMPNDVKNLRKF